MPPFLRARLSRLIPGIFPVERGRILPEIFAGISLAAMNIPQVMGYARIAEVPLITGLYTLLFPVNTFALFEGARYLFVAADSATAVSLSTGIAPMARHGMELFLTHTSVVALMTGGLLLLARILKLGFLADFLSRTVLIGFLSGVGVQVLLLDRIRRGYQPRTAVVVRDSEIHWRMEKTALGIFVEPGVILYWFGTALYYANAPHFCSEIRRLVEGSPGVRAVIVDCGPVTSMDFTAGKALAELRSDMESRGVTLALTRVTAGLRKDLDNQGLGVVIGERNLSRSRKQSLAHFRTTHPVT